MLFELVNVTRTFQNFINILKNNILDPFTIIYVNNILVFSITFSKYRKRVKTVLAYIQAAGLQQDTDKCKFEIYETKYLDLIIQFAFLDSCLGFAKICPAKTNAIDF